MFLVAEGVDHALNVLGGPKISGGRGSVLYTLMGAALVQSLSSASSFINQDSAVRLIMLGASLFSLAARERRRDVY